MLYQVNRRNKYIIFILIYYVWFFCNFVKDSIPSFIEFSRSSTLNEDISLTNADLFYKLISLVARFLFYMFYHFGARISFSALYKSRRVKVFFSSGNFRKMIDFMIFKTVTIYSIQKLYKALLKSWCNFYFNKID